MGTLEEEYVVECDWSKDGGSLTYDISYLHKDWDVLIQTYTIDSQDLAGRFIYGSEFLLFAKGAKVPSSFGKYAKELKAKLWEVIFAVKRRFFVEFKPDIVLHFIKQSYSVKQRFELYCKWLNFPDYDIDRTKHDIIYTKTTPADTGGGSSFKSAPLL